MSRLLLKPSLLVPVEPDCCPLHEHAVLVERGQIAAVAPVAEFGSDFDGKVIELAEHVLIPGLVNAHTHAAMSLLRGMADDLPLMEWLEQHIWPVESEFVGAEFVRDGTDLACAEMLLSGTTCFNDMYLFPDVTAQRASATGMRCAVGLIVIGFPTAWAQDTAEYLRKGREVHDAVADNPLVTTSYAPHAPYTVDDDALRKIQIYAAEQDIPVHTHLHETAHEVDTAVEKHGMRPRQRMQNLGLLSPSLAAVHMVHLDDDDIDACAENGVSVVHCPESNMKLASGACPVDRLVKAGVNMALGTDGAASNNDLDMFGEMRSAALLAKLSSQDARSFSAPQALTAATMGGATAMGLADTIGSIVPGKAADLVAVRTDGPASVPSFDIVSSLVYAGSASQVEHVWVAGRQVVRDRKLAHVDLGRVHNRGRAWQQRITEYRAR